MSLVAVIGLTAFACADPPDVQLLVVDTLRADHVGLYGYGRNTSPELDRFAQDAVVFDDAVAPSSWTLPSVASLLTGQYPSVHGLVAHIGSESVTSIRFHVPTLAELMQVDGYRTVAIVTNPWFIAEHGLARGFEEFEVVDPPTAEQVNRYATRALESDDPRPVFLYLHYMDVHAPYGSAPEIERGALGPVPREYVRDLTPDEMDRADAYLRLDDVDTLDGYIDAYDAGIRYWDREFGRWIDWLRDSDRFDNTILTVMADHGEEFLDHGGWNHGETLYQEQLWVPWLMHIPAETSRRYRDRVVSLVDFGPTLFALLDRDVPPSWIGTNALASVSDVSTRALFSETEVRIGGISDKLARSEAIRVGDKKLIETANGAQCYDLATDPREKHPLAFDHDCMSDLQQQLSTFRVRSAALAARFGESPPRELSPDLLRGLRTLGYVR